MRSNYGSGPDDSQLPSEGISSGEHERRFPLAD
jgi:hypothetical protein